MKQGVVKFSKEFVTNTGLKEWAGVEYSFDMDEESVQDVFARAKKDVSDSVVGCISSGEVMPPGPPPVIQVKLEDREIGLKIEDIQSCKSLTVLDAYKGLVANKPEMERAYILRREELVRSESKAILDATNKLTEQMKINKNGKN